MTETDLCWRLRQLPREIESKRDLWPAIHAGIQRRPARTPRRWLAGLALAATVALAAGLFWNAPDPTSPMTGDQVEAIVVGNESRAITDEYRAALHQFDGAPLAAQMSHGLREVDRSLVQIQRAIAADPDSVHLLQQLRKAYSRRLALTQRAVIS